MGPLEGLIYGLEVVFTPQNLLAAFIGVFAGTIIGLLPGLGAVAGAALLFPLTFTLDPAAGVIMIAGIYYGVMYAGSTTAILLNIPGEAPSVVASFEGYQMARKGRAGPALGITTVGAFIAGTICVVLVMLFSPLLAQVGLAFGPAEFFAITAGGLLALSRITGGSLMSNLFPLVIGVLLGTIGQEPVTSQFRYTFGFTELSQGVPIVPVAIGLFGLAEIFILTEGLRTMPRVLRVRVRDLLPSAEEWRRSVAPWGRGTIVGFLFGLLPGPSAAMSTFASYRLERSVSRHRDEFGSGAIEGLAGPEAANNAASTSSMIPVLSLGIPFSATLALLLSALIIQGITPGPLLIEQNPEIFWGVVASMYVGNLMLVFLNIPLIGVWVSILRLPQYILIPVILVVALIGAYGVNNSMLDMILLVILGFIGYAFRKLGFQLAPLLIGLVLGPFAETHLREGLFLSQGNLSYFVSTPLSIGVWSIVLLLMLGIPVYRLWRR